MDFGKGALLWLLGVPLPIILLLALSGITEDANAAFRGASWNDILDKSVDHNSAAQIAPDIHFV
jgi:hypothetical protein